MTYFFKILQHIILLHYNYFLFSFKIQRIYPTTLRLIFYDRLDYLSRGWLWQTQIAHLLSIFWPAPCMCENPFRIFIALDRQILKEEFCAAQFSFPINELFMYVHWISIELSNEFSYTIVIVVINLNYN